ncbi:hypothetical protein [Nocardiopsis alba]|uniref:hypothetical protein n=1 Tax=Nocardiopsis alba TaxID=53437 RepID=UPI00362BFBC6
MSFFEWVQSRLHHECDNVIAFYDQDRRASAQAQVESANAHHEAEQALAEARAQIARLEGEAATARARADQAEAALREVRRLVAEPVDLSQPPISQETDSRYTTYIHLVLIRLVLLGEANRHAGSLYGDRMEILADLYTERLEQAHQAIIPIDLKETP